MLISCWCTDISFTLCPEQDRLHSHAVACLYENDAVCYVVGTLCSLNDEVIRVPEVIGGSSLKAHLVNNKVYFKRNQIYILYQILGYVKAFGGESVDQGFLCFFTYGSPMTVWGENDTFINRMT